MEGCHDLTDEPPDHVSDRWPCCPAEWYFKKHALSTDALAATKVRKNTQIGTDSSIFGGKVT